MTTPCLRVPLWSHPSEHPQSTLTARTHTHGGRKSTKQAGTLSWLAFSRRLDYLLQSLVLESLIWTSDGYGAEGASAHRNIREKKGDMKECKTQFPLLSTSWLPQHMSPAGIRHKIFTHAAQMCPKHPHKSVCIQVCTNLHSEQNGSFSAGQHGTEISTHSTWEHFSWRQCYVFILSNTEHVSLHTRCFWTRGTFS